MRITDKVLNKTFTSNLAFASERLYESEMQVLTNKKLNKPSDNPVDALNSLAVRSKISDIEQYQRNISRSQTLLQNTETVVSQVSGIFERLHGLVVQGASDNTGPTDKVSISYEVNQLLEQVYNLANTRSETIYMFAGTNNDNPPYLAVRDENGEIVDVKTLGSGGDINTIIGENIQIKMNVNGEDLFEKDTNIFELLITIRDDLRADDNDALREDLIALSDAEEKVINQQAVIGSRLNRILSAETRAENDIINFTTHLSNTEDVDASEAIMEYQLELLTLQSSMQAGARLIQQRLTDFLR